MDKKDADKFKLYVQLAKDTVSDYMIPTALYRDMDDGRNPQFNEISVYEEFAWYHYYIGRPNLLNFPNENDRNRTFADFSHEGPAFFTWHRAYLLKLERMLQQVRRV
ncbi:tyrosinase-like [Ptychodera flava]|uniref:tyrosinase-like n=1 Tax=Ptychodera flava TaxID=63121 RepID=UPI00396A27C8